MRFLTVALLLLSAVPAVAAVPTPTDPLFADQSNLQAVGVDAVGAWETTLGRGAVVCLTDDGVDWFHRELLNAYALNVGEFPAYVTAGADGVLGLEDFPSWVTDVNVNGFLDTQDLLLVFSDGIDDDGNGYVDDIAGWDFDDDDNDAFDLWENSHGTGRAGILAARIDTWGSVGLMPEGKILAARVGDKILHTTDTLAEAIAYCADNGADSVNMSLGASGQSQFLRDAFRYAVSKGVVSAGASGNEGHYHHEWNASFDEVISVGSVIEAASPEGRWTEKNNTTDYGAKLELAAPTDSWTVLPFSGTESRREGGTSSAAPHVAAGAALLLQAAREQGTPITAREARQFLKLTATDIEGTKWGAVEGWDAFTGYGRVDYKDAIAKLKAAKVSGEFPPEADITSPRWYQVVPLRAGNVKIKGRVSSRTGKGGYTIEAGVGLNPQTWKPVFRTGFDTLVEGDLSTGKINLGMNTLLNVEGLNLAEYPVKVTAPLSELGNPQSYAITVRLKVFDDNAQENVSEDRQTFFVVDDTSTRTGFSIDNTSSIEAPLLTLDLNGDGKEEVVIADSDGFVTALRGDGSILWRTHLDPYLKHMDAPAYKKGGLDPRYEPVLGVPAAGDINADGKPEIVVPGLLGKLYAFKADGSRFWSTPVTTDYSRWPGEAHTLARLYTAAVVLADLDGDGKKEIIAGAQDQQLYAWHGDGSRVDGFPVFLAIGRTLDDVASGAYRPAPIAGIPAVGDLNQDGQLDIVVGTNEIDRSFFGHIFAVDGRGYRAPRVYLEGWPVATIVAPFGLPVVGEGVSGGMTLTDLDGDGSLEAIGGGFSGQGTIWNADGSHRASLVRNAAGFGKFSNTHEALVAAWTDPLATVADIDGDGKPEIYAGAIGLGSLAEMSLTEKIAEGGVPDAKHLFMGWNADGSSRDYFPRRLEGWAILTNPLIADVDGDQVPEIVVGSSGYYLHAYKNDGREPAGWPKFMGGWLFSTPAVVDADGDGRASVWAAVREGQVFAWNTSGRMADAPYPQMRATPDRAGKIDKFSPRMIGEGEGCSCRTSNTGGMSLTWLLVLLPFWRRVPRTCARVART